MSTQGARAAFQQLLLALAATTSISCVSRYYLPESLKGQPADSLVEINVSHFDHRAEVLVDGVQPWPLFGMPRRRLYLEPGEHTIQIHYAAASAVATSINSDIDLIDIEKGTWKKLPVTTTTYSPARPEESFFARVDLKAGQYDWKQITAAVKGSAGSDVIPLKPRSLAVESR